MYHLLTSQPLKNLFATQLLPFAISFGIAELFYKFHSFVLETGAFLVTWFVLDLIFTLIRKAIRPEAKKLSEQGQ